MASSFEERINRRTKQMETNVIRGARKAVSDALQVAAIETPVLTGFARGNWNVSIGAPDFSTTPPPGAINAGGEAFGRVIAKATGIINTWPVLDGSSIFIANGTPYIVQLEDGSSPKGRDMAKKAVIAAENGFVSVRLFR